MRTGYQPAYRVDRLQEVSIPGREVPQDLRIPVLRLPSLACAEPNFWLDFARTAAANRQRIQVSANQETKTTSLQGIDKSSSLMESHFG